MTYKEMLMEQILAKKKEAELRRLKIKEQDLKDLERINKDNQLMELRKLTEDQLVKDRELRMRDFNRKNVLVASGHEILKNSRIRNNSELKIIKNKEPVRNKLHTIEEESDNYNSDPGKYLHNVSIEDFNREIMGEIDIAKESMQYYKNRITKDLEYELRKEREFLEKLPEKIKEKIQSTMNSELMRLKQEVNEGSNILRDEILKLRSQAIELDQEKRKATEDLHKLRKKLAEVQYEDDIRTHELLNALAEDNLYKILPSSSRFTMPEALFKDDNHHKFPISYYDKNRVINGEQKLYSDGYFINDANTAFSGNVSKSLNFEIGGFLKSKNNFDSFSSDSDLSERKNNERETIFENKRNGKMEWEYNDF